MVATNDKSKKIYVGHINIRQSIFFLILKLIILDLIAAFLAVLQFLLVSNVITLGGLNGVVPFYNLSFFLILLIVKVAIGIYVVMAWLNEYYEIWPNLILHKRGFIIKNEDRHPFAHIKSIKCEQGFLGKFFGFGTITIYDWYMEKYTSLYLIHNPIKYYNIIEGLIPRTEEEKQIFQEAEEK